MVLSRAALKQAVMHAVPTIHDQAGENTMKWFKIIFPQGEIEELDLKVRVRETFWTRRILVEFHIARVKGFVLKQKAIPDASV